jgi:hypothetical protein
MTTGSWVSEAECSEAGAAMALAPIVAMAIRDREIVFIVATPVASARCFVRCEFAKLGSVNS